MKLMFLPVLLGLLILSSKVYADGYKIKIRINGVSDTVIYLGHHYGDKKYAKDTLMLDKTGTGTFTGKEKLDGGIYMILIPSRDMTYFELLLDEDQDFSMETDTTDYIQYMKVTGSEDNKQFYEFQRSMIEMQKRGQHLQELLKKYKGNEDSSKIVKDDMDKLNKERDDYWNRIISQNPKSLLAVIMKAMRDPEIPDFKIPEDDPHHDSLLQVKTYYYAKDHYFDNIDFSDKRLLRTPIFHNKLDTYMKKMILQHPDTIIKEGDMLVKMSEANDEVYRYVLVYMLGYYEKTKIMGMDKVFVHFGENYYLAGKADWADSTLKAKIAERVIALKPNLMGLKAPDMKLETFDGKTLSLYDVDAKYTVLFFYEPSCGHCKKTTPKMIQLYHKYKSYEVEVFAIYTQHDRKEWEDFINEHGLDWINVYDKYNMSNFRTKYDIYSTPVIYILNDKKEIIDKRIDVEQVDEMFKFLFKIKDTEEDMQDEENGNEE
ncbi:MAG: redoxin domain-containing protein [Bacteroidota bacterium]